MAGNNEDDELDDRVLFLSGRFAYVGHQLVSFPRDTSNTNDLHDKSTSYNTFYGEEYPSEFQMLRTRSVYNQNLRGVFFGSHGWQLERGV